MHQLAETSFITLVAYKNQRPHYWVRFSKSVNGKIVMLSHKRFYFHDPGTVSEWVKVGKRSGIHSRAVRRYRHQEGIRGADYAGQRAQQKISERRSATRNSWWNTASGYLERF